MRLTALALILLIAACSGPSAADQSMARETAHLDPMRAEYSNTVTGFDIHGTRLDVSIDLNQYDSIDDDTITALQQEALSRWVEAWKKENAGKHATLTMRFLNYFGKPFYTTTKKV